MSFSLESQASSSHPYSGSRPKKTKKRVLEESPATRENHPRQVKIAKLVRDDPAFDHETRNKSIFLELRTLQSTSAECFDKLSEEKRAEFEAEWEKKCVEERIEGRRVAAAIEKQKQKELKLAEKRRLASIIHEELAEYRLVELKERTKPVPFTSPVQEVKPDHLGEYIAATGLTRSTAEAVFKKFEDQGIRVKLATRQQQGESDDEKTESDQEHESDHEEKEEEVEEKKEEVKKRQRKPKKELVRKNPLSEFTEARKREYTIESIGQSNIFARNLFTRHPADVIKDEDKLLKLLHSRPREVRKRVTALIDEYCNTLFKHLQTARRSLGLSAAASGSFATKVYRVLVLQACFVVADDSPIRKESFLNPVGASEWSKFAVDSITEKQATTPLKEYQQNE